MAAHRISTPGRVAVQQLTSTVPRQPREQSPVTTLCGAVDRARTLNTHHTGHYQPNTVRAQVQWTPSIATTRIVQDPPRATTSIPTNPTGHISTAPPRSLYQGVLLFQKRRATLTAGLPRAVFEPTTPIPARIIAHAAQPGRHISAV
jgi:hypothetical protein